jgi:hypothetical protein
MSSSYIYIYIYIWEEYTRTPKKLLVEEDQNI